MPTAGASLPPASVEQVAIIAAVGGGKNAVVDSVAGSGKTTTTLHLARSYPADEILLLTYNAKLKLETRQKAEALGLRNVEVHSYHSFCVNYYDGDCHKDDAIRTMLAKCRPGSGFGKAAGRVSVFAKAAASGGKGKGQSSVVVNKKGGSSALLRPGGAHLFGGVEPSHLQAGDNLRKLHTALAP